MLKMHPRRRKDYVFHTISTTSIPHLVQLTWWKIRLRKNFYSVGMWKRKSHKLFCPWPLLKKCRFFQGLLMGYLGLDGWGAFLTSKVDRTARLHPALVAPELAPQIPSRAVGNSEFPAQPTAASQGLSICTGGKGISEASPEMHVIWLHHLAFSPIPKITPWDTMAIPSGLDVWGHLFGSGVCNTTNVELYQSRTESHDVMPSCRARNNPSRPGRSFSNVPSFFFLRTIFLLYYQVTCWVLVSLYFSIT